jgi:hypothetical protein
MNTLEQLVKQVETEPLVVNFQDQVTEADALIIWEKDLE